MYDASSSHDDAQPPTCCHMRCLHVMLNDPSKLHNNTAALSSVHQYKALQYIHISHLSAMTSCNIQVVKL